MNRRQWKKACKKAAEKLHREFPGEFALEAANGLETVYSPAGYEPTRREGRLGRHYTSPPRGTMGAWIKVSYEYDEWDFYTALSLYSERRFVEDFDWEAEMNRISATSAQTVKP